VHGVWRNEPKTAGETKPTMATKRTRDRWRNEPIARRRPNEPSGTLGGPGPREGRERRRSGIPERTQHQFRTPRFEIARLRAPTRIPRTNPAPRPRPRTNPAPRGWVEGQRRRPRTNPAPRTSLPTPDSPAPSPNEPTTRGAERSQWGLGWSAWMRRASAAVEGVSPNEPSTSFAPLRSSARGCGSGLIFPERTQRRGRGVRSIEVAPCETNPRSCSARRPASAARRRPRTAIDPGRADAKVSVHRGSRCPIRVTPRPMTIAGHEE
jgi:hypothetical protein